MLVNETSIIDMSSMWQNIFLCDYQILKQIISEIKRRKIYEEYKYYGTNRFLYVGNKCTSSFLKKNDG